MPYLDKPFNVSKESFDAIFGSAKLMYIASVSAYLVSNRNSNSNSNNKQCVVSSLSLSLNRTPLSPVSLYLFCTPFADTLLHRLV